LRNGTKLLEGEITKPAAEPLQEPSAQAALDQKAARRLPRAWREFRPPFHPQAPVMYFVYVKEVAAIDVGSELSVRANPGNRKPE
jgi:hypothetical protein